MRFWGLLVWVSILALPSLAEGSWEDRAQRARSEVKGPSAETLSAIQAWRLRQEKAQKDKREMIAIQAGQTLLAQQIIELESTSGRHSPRFLQAEKCSHPDVVELKSNEVILFCASNADQACLIAEKVSNFGNDAGNSLIDDKFKSFNFESKNKSINCEVIKTGKE